MLIDFFLKLKSHKLPGTPQDYAKFLAAEQAKWGPIVTAIGFKEQN
jgi:hypothetical protein